jgi:Domain of unknown function (DUF4287)
VGDVLPGIPRQGQGEDVQDSKATERPSRCSGLPQVGHEANELVAWLKKEFDLGHCHSMAIWAAFKQKSCVHASRGK